MNKVFAISSVGKTKKSFLDLRFGKCESIVIYDTSTKSISINENPYKDILHSGTKLVELLISKGVSTIITGEVGPLVSNILEKEKIQLVLLKEERIKIEDVLTRIS